MQGYRMLSKKDMKREQDCQKVLCFRSHMHASNDLASLDDSQTQSRLIMP